MNTVHYELKEVEGQRAPVPKQVIDKENLVDEAYAIASREGICALSVRKLAAACGIAVGSVYLYFPTKADLTAAVLTRFFAETLFEECCAVREGERFTAYARRFHGALRDAIAAPGIDWFAQMRRLPDSERSALETARAPMMAHMEQGLQRVLEADGSVDRARLVGALRPEGLCRFTLRTVFASLTEGADCEALFALLDAALYADAPSTGSGTVLWRNE